MGLRDGGEVMLRVRDNDFDVLVLDLSMPGRSVTPEVAEQLALGAMPGAMDRPHENLSDREFGELIRYALKHGLTDPLEP